MQGSDDVAEGPQDLRLSLIGIEEDEEECLWKKAVISSQRL